MADQSAIVQELYNRIGSLSPDKAAIVTELARRFNVGAPSDPLAAEVAKVRARLSPDQTRARSLDSMQLDNPYNFVDNAGGSFVDSAKDAFTGVVRGLVHLPTFDEQAGPVADQSKDLPAATVGRVTDQASAGNYGGATGTVLGTGAGIVAPMLAGEAVNVGVRGVKAAGSKIAAKVSGSILKTNLDPTEASAVQYGADNQVQMPTSVITGSKVAKDAENIAQNLPLMSSVAKEARTAEKESIAAAGANEVERLGANYEENRVGAAPPVPSKHGAVEAIQRQALENEAAHNQDANTAYERLRSIENQPQFKVTLQTGTKLVDGGLDENGNPTQKRVPVMEDIQLPVDYRGLKAAVKPLLDEVLRPMSIAQEQSSTGIKALRNVLDSPDFVPASVADQDLGALKAIMRESPQSRSVGQAKFAADLLSKQIDAAVERAGPDAVAALQQGRESTVAKYGAQNFQKAVGFKNVGTGSLELPEPVALAQKLTAPNDANINLLKRVADETPEHIPALAQAHIQELIDNATADAGMSREQSMLRKFNAQGPQTKAILYGDNAGRLRDFFTLNKMLAENPNPSGSAQVAALGTFGAAGGGLLIHNPLLGVPAAAAYFIGAKPLARMLFDPASSRLMMTALKMPAKGAGAALLAKQLVAAAGPAAVPVPASPAASSTAAGPASAPASSHTVITVPGEAHNSYKAEYKVIPRSELIASHSGITFGPNAEYGPLVNDHDYTKASNQGPVIGWSSRGAFDARQLINDDPNATNGPLAINSKKQILGGNNRGQILERVYSDKGHPGPRAYRDLLDQKAAQFGIDPKAYAHIPDPVLVREIPDSEFSNGRTQQQAITDFNKVGTKPLTPSERAVADAKRISPETLDHIAGQLEKHGADATVRDVLEGPNGQHVLNRLIKDGAMTDQERNALESEDGLTPAGKDRIEQLLAVRFIGDLDTVEGIPASIRGKITRLAAPLAQVEGRGDWSLTPAMKEAAGMLHRAQSLGIKNVDDFIAQDGLFGAQKYSAEAQQLARALQRMTPNELTAAARAYAGDANFDAAGSSLFGDSPTPAKSFEDSFGPDAIANALEARAAKKNALADAATKQAKAQNSLAPRDTSAEDAALARRKETQGGFLRLRNSLAAPADESGGGGRGSLRLGGESSPAKNALAGSAPALSKSKDPVFTAGSPDPTELITDTPGGKRVAVIRWQSSAGAPEVNPNGVTHFLVRNEAALGDRNQYAGADTGRTGFGGAKKIEGYLNLKNPLVLEPETYNRLNPEAGNVAIGDQVLKLLGGSDAKEIADGSWGLDDEQLSDAEEHLGISPGSLAQGLKTTLDRPLEGLADAIAAELLRKHGYDGAIHVPRHSGDLAEAVSIRPRKPNK